MNNGSAHGDDGDGDEKSRNKQKKYCQVKRTWRKKKTRKTYVEWKNEMMRFKRIYCKKKIDSKIRAKCIESGSTMHAFLNIFLIQTATTKYGFHSSKLFASFFIFFPSFRFSYLCLKYQMACEWLDERNMTCSLIVRRKEKNRN